MHGRPRNPPKHEEDAASSIAIAADAATLRTLQSQFLNIHHNRIYDKEALEISWKLLEMNPEVYTAWNYRKLAVENNLRLLSNDPDSIKALLDRELTLVERALRGNCNSYGAWHHRKWVLSKGFTSADVEFRLLDQFLKANCRNFQGWDYRRFVAGLEKQSLEDELKFTTDMINSNFSNYSAWHNRSVLLSQLLKQKGQGSISKEKLLEEEFELVHQALFTDPDDQSGWFYHLWLLDQTIKLDPRLISSWPIGGSDIFLTTDGNMDGCVLSPSRVFPLENVNYSKSFPLIIYFNQAVEGITSSTVSVEFIFSKNEDLVWRPLSSNNSGISHAWVTYLKIPDLKLDSPKAYPVEVSLGYNQGIISSSGSHYCHPFRFGFTLNLQNNDTQHEERESITEMFLWKDDSFHADNTLLEDPSPLSALFEQKRLSEDYEPSISKWLLETLSNEIALFRELFSEMNCKIAKLTLARLLMAHDAIMSYVYGTLCMHKCIHSEEVLELLNDLMKLDVIHSCYYKDEVSLLLMEQVTSNRESLVKHCGYYTWLDSSRLHKSVCLRLNKLSLSRIGFVERLLWVQMLDLSHNELQSIEGLEAMQLLLCLNLSNNKFSSFTALEPLRSIKSLKVLDVSQNEIGSNSIDTTRYLCSSPLSHKMGSDWKVEDFATDNVNLVNCWEAVLIFRDLHLAQLDIVGNTVCDEHFRLLLVRIIPTLKFLDGASVR